VSRRALIVAGVAAVGVALAWWLNRAPAGSVEVEELEGAYDPLREIEVQLWTPIVESLDLIGFDMTPRGIRTNNPGNMRWDGKSAWVGMTGNAGNYLSFDTPHNGIRAMARDLKNKAARGVDTVREVITAWAPPFENNTAAYIASVSDYCRCGPDSIPDRMLLVKAIIRHENGQQPYTDAQIIAGINAA